MGTGCSVRIAACPSAQRIFNSSFAAHRAAPAQSPDCTEQARRWGRAECATSAVFRPAPTRTRLVHCFTAAPSTAAVRQQRRSGRGQRVSGAPQPRNPPQRGGTRIPRRQRAGRKGKRACQAAEAGADAPPPQAKRALYGDADARNMRARPALPRVRPLRRRAGAGCAARRRGAPRGELFAHESTSAESRAAPLRRPHPPHPPRTRRMMIR